MDILISNDNMDNTNLYIYIYIYIYIIIPMMDLPWRLSQWVNMVYVYIYIYVGVMVYTNGKYQWAIVMVTNAHIYT